MKQHQILIYFFLFTMLVIPAETTAISAIPSCLKDLATNYYDEVYLDQALNMHRIYQSTWTPIRNELKRRGRNVPTLMYKEGKKQRPNPLDYPINSKEAEKIFIAVMYRQFEDTLNNFDIMNRGNIRDMFDYIRVRQQAKINACLY